MTPRIYQGIIMFLAECGTLLLAVLLLSGFIGLLLRWAGALPLLRRYPERFTVLARHLRGLLYRAALVIFLGLVGFNAYLLFYLRTDVPRHVLDLLPQISRETWLELSRRVVLVLLAGYGIRLLSRWLALGLQALRARQSALAELRVRDDAINAIFACLEGIRRIGLALSFLVAVAFLLKLPPAIIHVTVTALRAYLIISISRLLAIIGVLLIEAADQLGQRYLATDTLRDLHEQFRGLQPLLARSLESVLYVLAATLVVMQIEAIARLAAYGPLTIQIIGIFFFSRVVIALFYLLIDRLLLSRRELTDYQWQQRLTLAPLVKSVCKYATFFTAMLLILSVCGINTTPVLAALGGAGIIVGLGAQPVINDLISGLFILFENVYLVGDYVEIGNARGIVEAIDVRTTRVRGDPGGQVFVIRNGKIDNVNSYSKGYVYSIVEVGVGYGSDLAKVCAIIQEAGVKHAAADAQVLEPAEVKGIDRFDYGAMVVRVAIKARPGQHNSVARSFRRLIKEAFDREGIEMPFAKVGLGLRSAANNPDPAASVPKSPPPGAPPSS